MINKDNINKWLDKELEEWFTFPLTNFPEKEQEMIRKVAEISFRSGANIMLGEINKGHL